MTKTNIALATALLIAVLTILSAQTKQPQLALGQPGRYQLFAGDLDLIGIGGSPQKVILRIDTQTGTVYQWYNGKDRNGNLNDEWILTGNVREGKIIK